MIHVAANALLFTLVVATQASLLVWQPTRRPALHSCARPQIKTRKDGRARENQTKLINAYFRRDCGKLVPCEDHPYFEQIMKKHTRKYTNEWGDGALVSHLVCLSIAKRCHSNYRCVSCMYAAFSCSSFDSYPFRLSGVIEAEAIRRACGKAPLDDAVQKGEVKVSIHKKQDVVQL